MQSTQKLVAAFFCVSSVGHFQILRRLIRRVVDDGIKAVVYTDKRFREQIESLNATFVDLFERYTMEDADSLSIPGPCRHVSFAGHNAGHVIRDLANLKPDIIIYETFSVIAYIAGRTLGIPYVCVCTGHDLNPERYREKFSSDSRASVSDRCHQAVKKLRTNFAIEDADPFMFVTVLSPHLNIYCEPPEFLPEASRQAMVGI